MFVYRGCPTDKENRAGKMGMTLYRGVFFFWSYVSNAPTGEGFFFELVSQSF